MRVFKIIKSLIRDINRKKIIEYSLLQQTEKMIAENAKKANF